MLEEIINSPAVDEYMCLFKEGDILYYEGDSSQELYILVSGDLEIRKGNKQIFEVSKRGSTFGEVSFFLGIERTVTVKAKSDGEAIRIPKEKIYWFWEEFPSLSWDLTRILAQRLDITTQSYYVLKEFCDQLPDAVVAADSEGKIIAWNTGAEDLFGRTWTQMQRSSAEEVFAEPEAYKEFLEEIQFKRSVTERIFKVRNPNKGIRFISASTTALFDGHYRYKGFLSLNRDVTEIQALKTKHQRGRFWLIASALFIGMMTLVLVLAYPHFSSRAHIIGIKQQALRDQLAKDSLLLKSMLTDPFEKKSGKRIAYLMEEFIKLHDDTLAPYKGIVLLGKGKKVFAAFSLKNGKSVDILVGSSYRHITFHSSKKSTHKVLTLYRTGTHHPMGAREVEIAFEMRKGDEFLGWLLFQMDVDKLKNQFDINEETLRRFRF